MYANSNSSGSKASNDNSNNIPEWKKKLIMKKRAGNSINIDDRDSGLLSESNIYSSQSSEFDEISPLQTVRIGHLNVALRSALETPKQFSDLESEKEENQDLQYGPGIVDRLRERFLNMGAAKQCKPVRRFSSLENLPCSLVRPFKLNTRPVRQNGFKLGSGNVKKAQSMETLIYSAQEPPIFLANRRPNARAVKARILAPNLNPILPTVEMEEPSLRMKSVHRWDSNRSSSAPSINEEELPKPDTVKHVKKLFEGNNDRERTVWPLTKLAAKKETSSEIDKSVVPRHSSLALDGSLSAPLLPGPEPSAPNGNSFSLSDASSGTSLHDKIMVLPNSPQETPPETTSIVFDFRGKDVKPNISLKPTPFGCQPARIPPKKRSVSPPRAEVNGEADASQIDEEDWDEMDIGADLPRISGIVFTGENVKVGRGAILETRNKKLTLQFAEQAPSTFEYPSENASPSTVDANPDSSFHSLLALGSLTNSRFSSYAPQAVPSEMDFELGISQPRHRLAPYEKLDADPSIVPTDANGWSSTKSTDILF